MYSDFVNTVLKWARAFFRLMQMNIWKLDQSYQAHIAQAIMDTCSEATNMFTRTAIYCQLAKN